MQRASQVFTHGRGEIGGCHPPGGLAGQCGNESPAQGAGEEVYLPMELSASPVPAVPQFPLQAPSSERRLEIPMGTLHREHQGAALSLPLGTRGDICLFLLIFPFAWNVFAGCDAPVQSGWHARRGQLTLEGSILG